MGFLDTLTGGNIGGNYSDAPWKNAGKTSAVFNNISELQSIQSMLSFLGIDQQEWLQQYALTGKAGKKEMKNNPATTAKIGGVYYKMGGVLGQKAGLAEQSDAKAVSNSQKKYYNLTQQPMLATLAAQAEGKFDGNFTKVVNDMFQKSLSNNFGAAVVQGFANDPNKQASLTQPAAVAQAKYLQDYQMAAQGTLQGLAGLPQTQAFNPNILAGPQSAQSYLPGVFNAGQMNQQNQQYNATMGFQQQQAQNQAAMGFAQFAAGMGGGAASMFGGMGGAGGGYSGGGVSAGWGQNGWGSYGGVG